jgi:PPOX class probable F420-dependent enzyme
MPSSQDLSPAERAFLASARTATLATIAPDGAPRLVPCCFVLDPGRPVIHTPIDEKPKTSIDPGSLARVRDIRARPAVSILVDRWDEDWDRLAWLRAVGHASLVGPQDPGHAAVVAALRAKYDQYRTQRLEVRPIIRIELERVTSWGHLDP